MKLQDLPFRLLAALLEQPGVIVTREQLRERLWGDTVVDFDDGLHTAVRKLRDALGDSAAHPRFIETVPRRGYRFMASLSTVSKIDIEKPGEAGRDGVESTIHGEPAALAGRIVPLYLWMASAGILALGLLMVLYSTSKSSGNTGPVADLLPLTSYRGLQRSPALSPDGTQVAFTWDGGIGGNLDLYIQNVDGSGRVKLTSDQAPDLYPAWSPDGRTIAFVRNQDVVLIPAIGGPEHKITSAVGLGLSWSADSQTIAFADREAPGGPLAIYLISVNSRERHRLTAPAAKETDSWPAFSPEGREVAFVRATTTATNAYRIPALGGVPTRVATVGRPLRGLVWSPDGQYLLMATGRQPPGLLAVSANARDEARQDRIDIAGSDVYEISVNGRGPGREMDLAYSHEISNWDIWGAAIGNDRPSPTPLAASSRADEAPSFSPDGLRLAYSSTRSGLEQIWVSLADGSQPRQLTHFSSGLASSPRWSPDGQSIVFDATINNNRDIYVVRADGASPVRLTSEMSAEAQPSWSRSGQWIYFMSDRSGSQQIWKMPAGGGQPSPVTKGGGYQALESPDGQTLYYAKERHAPGIWSVPANGGSEILVSKLAWQNLWAVANDGVYYFDLSGQDQQVFDTPRQVPLRKIDLNTEKVTTVTSILTDLPNGVPALDVRGDGKYLAWVGRREHRSELMLIRNLRLGSR